MNQAQRTIAEMNITSDRVMTLLRWDESRYYNFQYECGLEYLHEYITDDPIGADKLQRSKYFWSWWRNQWLLRERQYLAHEIHNLSLAHRVNIYEQLHNPRALAKEIKINSIILDETYAVMIQEVHKNEPHL